MAVKINRGAYAFAKQLIADGKSVLDDRDAWSEHQPSTAQENEFIRDHGFAAYAKWHLGIDDEAKVDTKARYKFPYGDFLAIHRCAILTIESRAGQFKYVDIQRAAAHLHGMLEELRTGARGD